MSNSLGRTHCKAWKPRLCKRSPPRSRWNTNNALSQHQISFLPQHLWHLTAFEVCGASTWSRRHLVVCFASLRNPLPPSLPRTSATPSPKPLRRGDSDSGGVCGFAHLLRYSILRNDARRSPASIGSGNGDSSKPPSHLTTAAPAALLPAAATAAADDEDEDVWPPTPPPLSPPQRQQVASSSSTTTSPRAAQGNRVFTRATRRDAIQPPRLRHLVSALFPFPWFTYLHTYTLLTHYGSNAPVFAGCGEAQTRPIARGLVP